MQILSKTLSEKAEAIYNEIVESLCYPVKIEKMDVTNEGQFSQPVAMDTGLKEFRVLVDDTLEDNLFENALIRDLVYCRQLSSNAPILTPVNENDIDAKQTAMMISSIIMDINVEETLRKHDMHLDDIDTMRLSDLFAFLKAGMNEYNRKLYNILIGLQVILLLFTSSNKKGIEDIVSTFYMTDPDAMDMIDRFTEVIEKYGVEDNRSMMRCMRKIAAACDMKDRINLEYEGKVTTI